MPGLSQMLNMHPLFVHFPIALTITALLFEVVRLFRPGERWAQLATILIYIAAVSSVATVVSGYRAADILGHDAPGHDLVHVHRDIMLSFTGLIVAVAVADIVLARIRLEGLLKLWYKLARPLLLVAAAVVLVLGADRGGQLVFQHGAGVRMNLSIDHETLYETGEHSGQIPVEKSAPQMEADDHSAHDHSH